MPLPSNKFAAELSKRRRAVEDSFPKQQAFIRSKARRKAALGTRRCGKTVGVLIDMVLDAMDHPRSLYAYIALTKESAETIAWNTLKDLSDKYDFKIYFIESKLRAEFPNGASLSIYGADNPIWIRKFKGHKYRGVAIDEAGEFTSIDLRDFINRIISPCLVDQLGILYLVGTPGYILDGMWWDVTRPDKENRDVGWDVHEWSIEDNPHVSGQWAFEYASMLKEYGNELESFPWFQREWRGRWVVDTEDNVYAYEAKRNNNQIEPDFISTLPPGTRLCLGVDAGYTDATAFVLGAYGPELPHLQIIECYKRSEMLFDDIAGIISDYMGRFPGLRIIADPNSRRFMEEMVKRHHLPLEPANKFQDQKPYAIGVMNNDFQAGRIKLNMPACVEYAKELVELKKLKKPNNEWKEHPLCANDLCDAALYVHRETLHYKWREREVAPAVGTPEYYETVAQRLKKQSTQRLKKAGQEWWER